MLWEPGCRRAVGRGPGHREALASHSLQQEGRQSSGQEGQVGAGEVGHGAVRIFQWDKK